MRNASSLLGLMLAITAGCGTTNNPTSTADLSSPDMAIDCKANPQACPCRGDGDCLKVPNSPRCDVTVGQCVACLPVNDNCTTGSSCRKINSVWACLATCVDGDSSCQKILGPTSSCCGGACIDIAKDVLNCGACGNPCPAVSNGQPACTNGACVVGICNTNFADCDKSPADGCEANLGSDTMNCGACGTVCMPGPNAGAMCSGGKCSSLCLPGWSDCNGDPKDGCEVNTDANPNNCGGCGKACLPPAHATGACDGGKCAYRCALNFGDCDGNVANGCETDVSKDPNNCGHCANVCPVRPNAQAAQCTAGQCTNVCNKGYGDCDGNLNNGCESDTSKDMANCGGCGMLCNTLNTQSAVCAGSTCTLVCKMGFSDCDMDSTTGCEAQLSRDSKNCGACGNVCPMNTPFCSKGQCGNILPSVNYTGMFQQGQSSPQQCADWQTFQTALVTGPYSTITINGSLDMMGVSCTQAGPADQLCQALHNHQNTSVFCDGRTWQVGVNQCNQDMQLTATGCTCCCDGSPSYILRPCIANNNWGNVGPSGSCNAPSQTMNVSCQ
jgi:hypothetical protein